MLHKINFFIFFILFSFSNFNSSIQAAVLPSGFAEKRIARGIDPTSIKIAPDGRLFVGIKSGQVLIYKNNQLLSTPFLNLTVDNNNERGLQSIILDPNFSSNNYIYVYYAVAGGARNRVSRFTANGDISVSGSELVLIELDALSSSMHNGGSMFFKDGKLFITTGDGGSPSASQSFSSTHGKVLRINSNGSIPSDNPFISSTTGKYQAIYALGFRNPFKAAIQPGTGRAFVNDVGNTLWEEINDLLPGKNYGWPIIEGKRVSQTAPANYQDPIFAYNHQTGCSITGGTFYNPSATSFPSKYVGKYFYQDFCNGQIRVMDPSTGTLVETFASNIVYPVDITVGLDGTLYYIARQGLGDNIQSGNTSSTTGEIWQIRYTGNGLPTISAEPIGMTLPIGGRGTFVSSASGDNPLSFQWQKNGVNIPGATSWSYTLPAVSSADNGSVFRVRVTNSLGVVTSAGALLTVSSNHSPAASITITLPNNATKYNAGQVLNFSGTATDEEDGVLPATAFTWKIDFHHGTHFHPALAPKKGVKSGTYSIPTSGEVSSNVWFRVYLTVIDSDGQPYTTYEDVLPNKSTIILNTIPSGLKLKLDGTTYTTPYTFTGVVGVKRTIDVVTPQEVNGSSYPFVEWSHGGAAQQEISTPSTNTTYTATFGTSGSDIYEAEHAVYSGAGFGKTNAGFTGTGYLDYNNPFSDYIEWTVMAPFAGSYALDFRYALPTGDRPLEIRVNNNIVSPSFSFPGTGSWTKWETRTLITNLNQGANKVRTITIGSNGGNLDHLKVSPVNFSKIFEAEDATILGVTIGKVNPGFTGRGYVDYTNNFSDYIEWTVDVPSSGSYALDFRYALGTGNKPLEIRINNSVVASSFSFPATGSWSKWETRTLIAHLNQGFNKVRTIAIGSNGGNIDHLKVSPISFSEIFEAEDALLSGVTTGKNNPGYTGRGYADFNNNFSDFIEWTINVPSSGNYSLGFRYTFPEGNRPLEIRVNNNTVSSSFSFPGTGSWTAWKTQTLVTHLNQGFNKVRAIAIGSNGGNYDHLRVTPYFSTSNARLAPEEEAENIAGISLYPIPANNRLIVKSENYLQFIELGTFTGEIVKVSTTKIGDSELEIDVSQLKVGLYIVTFKSGEKIVTKKISIKR